MSGIIRFVVWTAVAALGAIAIAVAAFQRSEPVNALWLVVAGVCTFAIGGTLWMKIFRPKAAGFLPAVRKLEAQLAAGVPADKLKAVETALFSARLDIVVVTLFLSFVTIIMIGCAWEWWRILSGVKKAVLHESPYVAIENVG